MRSLPVTSTGVPVLLLVVAGLLAACAPAAGPASSPATGAGAGSAVANLSVTDAWVRAAPAGGTSAAYFQLANGGGTDAVITGATSDVAEATSIHDTSTDSGGMTGMHHVPTVTVEAGQTLAFEPGGYHVMLERLTEDLVAGSTVTVTLELEGGGTLDVAAEVRAG
jgi:copper(I)-binding protein